MSAIFDKTMLQQNANFSNTENWQNMLQFWQSICQSAFQIPKIQDQYKPHRSQPSNIVQSRHSCIKPQFEPFDECCSHLSLGYSQISLDLKPLFPFHCVQTRLGLSEMPQDGKLTSLSFVTPCLWQIRSLGQCSTCALPKRAPIQTCLWFTTKFGWFGDPLFW